MPEWFSHQCMGDKVNIMEPFSQLCNEWIGIAICVVFCPLAHHQIHDNLVFCILKANGKKLSSSSIIDYKLFASSDHIWLLYLLPHQFWEEDKKSLWEYDANGFREIEIEIKNSDSSVVKKCGLRVVYKKDIEDLNHTMVQCSNNSIIPYKGLEFGNKKNL